MNRFFRFSRITRMLPLMVAGTPLIDNKTKVTKTVETTSDTPSTWLTKVYDTVISTIHYPKGTETNTVKQMAKIASEDKIRTGLSFDHPDRKKLQSAVAEYKKTPLNICVLGQAGVGKSSFINAIRGIDHKHLNAAPAGITESTLNVTPYEVTSNKNVRYWDVPDVGTGQFSKETYLESIGFDRYDTFILMIRENVVEDDIWLMTEIENVGKKYIVVVSKIDIKIQDGLHQDQEENVTLEKIRAHVLQNVKTVTDVYLISNYLENIQRWDFPRLMKDIAVGMPERKKEAMLATLMVNRKRLVQAKIQKLRRRHWDILAASAGSSTIPVATIVNEATLYRKELGLDDESLAHKCDLHGLSIDELEAQHPELFKEAHELVLYLVESYEAAKLVEKAISTIPIVGQLTTSLVDDTVSYTILEYMLSHFQTAAENIDNYIIKTSKIINS